MDNRHFHDLLLNYIQEPKAEIRKGIETQLWDQYGQTVTIMVVDMSGFTRLSREHGIVHYLSMVRRMQLTSRPIVESYRGRIVRFEADNAYACFEYPDDAVRAAVALNLAMEAANIITPDELDIKLSCGIDHGKCLIPSQDDFFGAPVNNTSKLGEDLGEPGQILVTDHAMSLIEETYPFESEILSLEAGGEMMAVHTIKYSRSQK
ncbi:MAG: adenylate/guanylate cyclase domain-containing protein [Gammaproteobacteria bacterium]|nr:adenylate/guanylate cyclase domain-containing protein [Gammaproteobacteria bacterium]